MKGDAMHTSVSRVSLAFVSGLCSAPLQLFWGRVTVVSALQPPIPFSQVHSCFSIAPPPVLGSSGHVSSPQTQASLSPYPL